jgi:hypothetical protein
VSVVTAAPTPSTAVAAAVGSLDAAVRALHEAVRVLRTQIAEDQPDDGAGHGDNKAVTDLLDAADDLSDAVEAALGVVGGSSPAPAGVVAVHRGLLAAGRVMREELLAVDGRFDVARRAAGRWAKPWQAWARVVRAGLLDAADALTAAEEATADAVAALLDTLLDPGTARAAGTAHEEAHR